MLQAFLPASATRVVVYLHPITMRWGAPKLRAFCTETIGIAPDYATAFVFTNKARDSLLLYSLDEFDGQILTKKLEKGAFLLPAASDEGTPATALTLCVMRRKRDYGAWWEGRDWGVERLSRLSAKATAKLDGIETIQAFWQDPGQAGKSQVTHITTKVLMGYQVRFKVASKDKQTYAGPVSSLAEQRQILIKRGAWNDAFLAVLEGFPTYGHDDDVDAFSRAAQELFPNEAKLDPQYDSYLPKLRM